LQIGQLRRKDAVHRKVLLLILVPCHVCYRLVAKFMENISIFYRHKRKKIGFSIIHAKKFPKLGIPAQS
jgi:hypothetical protein